MKQNVVLIVALATLFLAACSKQDKVPTSETEASATMQKEEVTPEQQAAIDAIDKPVLDEKNQDVPAEIANVPADAVTIHEDNKDAK